MDNTDRSKLVDYASTKMDLAKAEIDKLIDEDINSFVHGCGLNLADWDIDLFIKNTVHCPHCGTYKVEVHTMTMNSEYDEGVDVIICKCGKSSQL
jgi:uncharacterized Zn finger protein